MEKQKKGIVEKIINAILNVLIFIFGIIFLISIYTNVQVNAFGKDYSDFFGYSIFEVQTGSMKDAINPGDWIIVKSSSSIKLDDVVTYKQDDEFITHRVIGVYNDTYVTKGDANNSKDEPIDKKQIIGKVVKILPNFGIFKKTIFNPVVLVAIITTILIGNFVFKKKKREDKKMLELKINEKVATLSSNLSKSIKESKEKRLENKKFKEELKKIEKERKDIQEALNQIESIPTEEVNNLLEEEPVAEEISSYIPVDVSELDDTFLEIAQNEMEEPIVEEKKTDKKEEKESKEVDVETPTKLNLELLENGKKSKNLIDKFVSIKVEELNEIINILDDDGKTYVNEATIKNKLMVSYIDSKYYNYYGETDVSANKKQSVKIDKYMEDVSALMKSQYKGSDIKYAEKVSRFLDIFKVIISLEQASTIQEKRAKEEFYKKELTKYAKKYDWDNTKVKNAITNILKIQRNYVGILEYLFKKIETNMFNLEFTRLKIDKNIYALNLDHNITFSQIYSDYIIDKTYNEGVIAENKIVILLNLLSIRLVKDMIESSFNRKYVMYLPRSIYTKEKKIEKVLRMIDDEHAKQSALILIQIEDLVKHKSLIKKLKKDGYQFAIGIDAEFKMEDASYVTLNLADYIFVDKNIPNIVKTLSSLPEDVTDKFVYEDIIDKIGDFGGE